MPHSLMTIPRELRDAILEYVILSHQNEAPDIKGTFEELTQHRQVLRNPALGSWCNLVLNLPDSTIANATNLFLTNRQLHAETLESIDFLNARVYELDVIILDEILPLPTWTHVPLLTTSLDKVNVTFRISGSYDRNKERPRAGNKDDVPPGLYAQYGRYKGFRGGAGAGPAIGWQIYSILERFIKAGPGGELENKDEHRHIVVKTLDINIETPPDVDPARFGPPKSGYGGRQSHREMHVLDPAYLTAFVAGDISGLLRSGHHEWFRYGMILYEHVDSIVIRKDGEEMSRLDVAERLRDVGGFQERHISAQMLAEYKEGTWEKRRERGLRVLEE